MCVRQSAIRQPTDKIAPWPRRWSSAIRGWGGEPSMEYMTDAAHLRWKIAQVQTDLKSDIHDYRRAARA
jgi:hypothetical protein